MYRGFPVGYFVFWENANAAGAKPIGIESKQHKIPNRLIVDGQQRLTSLYAVFRGRTVLDDNYAERRIEVSFRPREGKFKVADAATRNDPEWIPNISDLSASSLCRRASSTIVERVQVIESHAVEQLQLVDLLLGIRSSGDDKFSDAVTELQRKKGESPQKPSNRLYRGADEARLKSEDERLTA